MAQTPTPERNGSIEASGGVGGTPANESTPPASAFSALAQRLLKVSPAELLEAERKWREDRDKRHS
jgi:hypothetical protein